MTSPFLTADQAAEYLGKMKDGKPNKKALYEFLRRHPVRIYHLGANVRYHRDDLEALFVFSHVSTDRVVLSRVEEKK